MAAFLEIGEGEGQVRVGTDVLHQLIERRRPVPGCLPAAVQGLAQPVAVQQGQGDHPQQLFIEAQGRAEMAATAQQPIEIAEEVAERSGQPLSLHPTAARQAQGLRQIDPGLVAQHHPQRAPQGLMIHAQIQGGQVAGVNRAAVARQQQGVAGLQSQAEGALAVAGRSLNAEGEAGGGSGIARRRLRGAHRSGAAAEQGDRPEGDQGALHTGVHPEACRPADPRPEHPALPHQISRMEALLHPHTPQRQRQMHQPLIRAGGSGLLAGRSASHALSVSGHTQAERHHSASRGGWAPVPRMARRGRSQLPRRADSSRKATRLLSDRPSSSLRACRR